MVHFSTTILPESECPDSVHTEHDHREPPSKDISHWIKWFEWSSFSRGPKSAYGTSRLSVDSITRQSPSLSKLLQAALNPIRGADSTHSLVLIDKSSKKKHLHVM
jgi:hypothetical protein